VGAVGEDGPVFVDDGSGAVVVSAADAAPAAAAAPAVAAAPVDFAPPPAAPAAVGVPVASTANPISGTTTATMTVAERRLSDGVSAALAKALRAVPVVRAASSSSSSPHAVADPPVYAQQGGGGDMALVQVAVPAGTQVIPNVIEVPDAPSPFGGLGSGFGGFGGGVTSGTSTPVRVATPITVDTPVRQSVSQTPGFQLFGRRLLFF
jgi:hypothetical protein